MALQAKLLEKSLRADGHTVIFFASNLPFPRFIAWLERVPIVRTGVRAILIWMKVWKLVRQVDVIHVLAASWVYFFIVVCPVVIAARVCGRRVVLNYRGGEAERFFSVWAPLVGPIFRMASAVTAPSGFLAEIIWRSFRVPVQVVPNILDTSTFKFRARPVFQPRFLVTRNLDKCYGVDVVLETFRVVQEKYPDATLWIAGSGSEEAGLRRLAAEWKLKGVRFLGHVAQCDLPAVYDECDIYLNASRVDNFPGALMEASASGLAIVSTRAGGIPAMYESGKSALLVPVDDFRALTLAVERLLQEPSLGGRLTHEAAAMVRRCHWDHARVALYKAYGFSGNAGLPATMTGTCNASTGSPR